MRTLALLLGAAVCAPVIAAAAPPAGDVRNASPLVHQQALLAAPRTATVRFTLRGRTLATTAGALQDAHRAIAASRAQAAARGRMVSSTLDGSTPITIGAPGTHPTTPPDLTIRATGSSAAIRAARSTVLAIHEDATKFANLPADARRFCTAAHATACAYLPQAAIAWEDAEHVAIMDISQTPAGCAATSGAYTYQMPTPAPDDHYQLWGWCTYTYPRLDKTTLAPVSKVYVQQTCSDPMFKRTVRDALVSVRIKNIQPGNTDFSPHWCAIRVAVDERVTQHGRQVPQTRPRRR